MVVSPSKSQHLKPPPIPQGWIWAGMAGTVVLLALTVWRVMTPPQSPTSTATPTVEKGLIKPTVSEKNSVSEKNKETAQGAAVEKSENGPQTPDVSNNPPSNQPPEPLPSPKAQEMAEKASDASQANPQEDKPVDKSEDKPATKQDSRKDPTQESAKVEIQKKDEAGKQAADSTPQQSSPSQSSGTDQKTEPKTEQGLIEQLQTQAKREEAKHGDGAASLGPTKSTGEEIGDLQKDAQARWLTTANRFADQHHGRVLDSMALTDGTIRLPTAYNAEIADVPFWFLSGGRLETDSEVYSFGADFQSLKPTMQQDLSKLAEKLGLASVVIELHPRGNDLVLSVTATAKSNLPKEVPAVQTELSLVKNKLDRLHVQLTEWQRLEKTNDSEETRQKKQAVREAILHILDMQSPETSKPITTGESLQKKDPEAAEKAQHAQDESAQAWEQMLANADALARTESNRLEVRVRDLQNKVTEALSQHRVENDRAVERFKKSCRKISAVIYPAEGGNTDPSASSSSTTQQSPSQQPTKPPTSTNPQAESAEAKKTAASPSFKPSVVESTAKPAVATISPKPVEGLPASVADLKATSGVEPWAVDYQESFAENAFTPTYTEMARLTVHVVSGSGTTLPKWFVDDFNLNCTIYEFPKDGTPRSHELMNVSKPKTFNITEGTSQVAIRFWFSPKTASASRKIPIAAETPWHILESIQRGGEYRLKTPLTLEMLSPLQPKPAKTGSSKKSS